MSAECPDLPLHADSNSHSDKIGIHGQPRRLALLGMELAGRQVVAPDDRGEGFGIVGFRGDIVLSAATA